MEIKLPTGPKIPTVFPRSIIGDNNVGATAGMSIAGVVAIWQVKKNEASKNATEAKQLNEVISSVIDEQGEEDNKGHRWLELPRPVQGYDAKGNPKQITKLQRQRRVTVTMDEDAATEILEEKGLLNEVSEHWIKVTDPERALAYLENAPGDGAGILLPEVPEIRTELNQDAVDGLYFEEKLTKDEVDQIFTRNVTYALYAL